MCSSAAAIQTQRFDVDACVLAAMNHRCKHICVKSIHDLKIHQVPNNIWPIMSVHQSLRVHWQLKTLVNGDKEV